jgi:hypothetical protein
VDTQRVAGASPAGRGVARVAEWTAGALAAVVAAAAAAGPLGVWEGGLLGWVRGVGGDAVVLGVVAGQGVGQMLMAGCEAGGVWSVSKLMSVCVVWVLCGR